MTSFIDFCSSRGLVIERLQSMKWVRCRTVDHPRKRNGAYWYEGRFGVAQNWATMDRAETWFQDSETKSDPDMLRRMEEARLSNERRRFEDAIRASQKAEEMLSRAIPYQHPYLVSKGLPDVLGMVLDQTLLVRMEDLHGKLVGLQTIEMENGEWTKRMLFGTRAKGAVLRLNRGNNPILCEGYATGLSILAAVDRLKLDMSVVVCFSAGNLVYVAEKMPKGAMVFADNDVSGTGQDAARRTQLPWVTTDEEGTDANDLHKSKGLLSLCRLLREVWAKAHLKHS